VSVSATARAPTALPKGLRQVAPEVVCAEPGLVLAREDTIAMLKSIAEASPRRRARLCAHPHAEAEAQEMLIVMSGATYVRPHRHFGKTESFTVFEGEADLVLFAEDGSRPQTIRMAPYGGGDAFFYRMPEGVFHGLIFRTPWLVYLETTIGPFDPALSEPAPWAPPETDPAAGRAFYADLELG
jgi:cupin fold WbuC family metalloprotein